MTVGKLEKLTVFSNDYDTVDGTSILDYLQVVDLAAGHSALLKYLQQQTNNMISHYSNQTNLLM